MRTRLILLLAGSLLTGCVEHVLKVGVLPDGSTHLILTSRGDSRDLFDDDMPHPTGWLRDTTWTVDKEDTIWVPTSQLFSADTQFQIGPKNRPVIDIIRRLTHDRLSTEFVLSIRFPGREVYSRYPQVGPVLLDEAPSDSIQWQRDVLRYLYSQAVLSVDVGESARKQGLTPERLIHHINLFLMNEYDPVPSQLPDHNQLLPAILQPFKRDLPPGYADSLVSALQPHLLELNQLHNLKDDSFIIKVCLPGKLVFTNADSLVRDTLIWHVKLENFLQDDYQLVAESMVVSGRSIQRWILLTTGILLISLILIFLVLGLYRYLRRRR